MRVHTALRQQRFSMPAMIEYLDSRRVPSASPLIVAHPSMNVQPADQQAVPQPGTTSANDNPNSPGGQRVIPATVADPGTNAAASPQSAAQSAVLFGAFVNSPPGLGAVPIGGISSSVDQSETVFSPWWRDDLWVGL